MLLLEFLWCFVRVGLYCIFNVMEMKYGHTRADRAYMYVCCIFALYATTFLQSYHNDSGHTYRGLAFKGVFYGATHLFLYIRICIGLQFSNQEFATLANLA